MKIPSMRTRRDMATSAELRAAGFGLALEKMTPRTQGLLAKPRGIGLDAEDPAIDNDAAGAPR